MSSRRMVAVTRKVSPKIDECHLTFMDRDSINADRAVQQHDAYEGLLRKLGAEVVSMDASPELPDSVFTEDNAVTLDEVSILARMGAPARQPEVDLMAEFLGTRRDLVRIEAPATLEGGDIIRAGRHIFVGTSGRTNEEGFEQLKQHAEPYGYDVVRVDVPGCLHLSTGASHVGNGCILANTDWVDATRFNGYEVLPTPADESWAGNTLLVHGAVIMGACFPRTREMLESRGFDVHACDISEMMKAEAGLTCMSQRFFKQE